MTADIIEGGFCQKYIEEQEKGMIFSFNKIMHPLLLLFPIEILLEDIAARKKVQTTVAQTDKIERS